MELRNVGGVLIGAGAACLLFFGVSYIYWVSDVGRVMTKLLLLTSVVALGGGAVLFALGQGRGVSRGRR
jgi:hypothetical protein